MHNSRLKRISVLVSLAVMSLTAEAAGLGKLTAMSGLGEPLNAEIELLSVSPEEMSSLTAIIASDDTYAAQGIERPGVINAIQVSVAKKADGSPYLKLSTHQPVTDPFVDMLIQVDWSTGRLLREFTLLLDPPGFNAGSAASQPAMSSAKPAATGSSASASQKQVRAGKIAKPVAESLGEHKTKRGDTLIKIAKEMQIEGVSLERMLVGIYQANQDAFAGNNMNQLKVGKIIRKPAAEDVSKISQSEAQQEIKVHARDWNAYKNKLAGAVSQQSSATEEAPSQAASGKIGAPAEDKATPPAQGPRDVVKLSKGETESTKAGPVADKATGEKLNALQEEVVASTQRLKEANERVTALEKQIQDMQKLLELKSQAMAELQGKAAEQIAQPAPVAEKQPEQVKPEPQPTPQPPANVEQPKEEPAKPVKKPVVAQPEPVEEPSMLPDPMLLGLGGGALALLAGGWFFYRNKRKRSLDTFEKGILTAGGLKANTVFGNTAGGTVDTGNTSFLTDFSQSTGGSIDTHDVDPVAEAEVYMAYGREVQAEEILKDAIIKDPKRYELHLKLLEIYAGRNDKEAFETVAGELYATLGSADPTWHKVAEMGRKLEPDNPLYATDSTSLAGAAAFAASASALDINTTDDLTEKAGESFPLAEVNTVTPADDLDFKPDQDNALDFDLGGFGGTSMGDDAEASEEMPGGLADFPAADEPALEFTAGGFSELSDKSGLDFSLDSEPESSSLSLDASAAEEPQFTADNSESSGFGYTMPSLDISGFDVPEINTAEETVEAETPVLELPGIEETIPAGEPEEIVFDVTAAESEPSGLDFTLDIPDSKVDEIAEEVETLKQDLPDIDLSGISLDLNTVSVAEPVSDFVGVEGEPESVNTKLDLVSAYLDMDDKEGARELLQEVLNEGGEKQRARAQEFLAKLA